MSKHKKNAGKGYGMMFHGAFASKADAVAKERKLRKQRNPNAFIQPRNIKGERRYVVMSERKSPRKRSKNRARRNMDDWTLAHFGRWFDEQFPEGRYDEAQREHIRKRMIEVFDEDPEHWGNHSYHDLAEHVGAFHHLHGTGNGNPMDLVVMGANPKRRRNAAQEITLHPGQTVTLRVNPSAESIREGFVGGPLEYTTVSDEPGVQPGNYAKLGMLMGFTFKPMRGGQVEEISYYSGKGGSLIAASDNLYELINPPEVVSDETARQIYFFGGNQDVSSQLHSYGARHRGQVYELGEMRHIVYRERKAPKFDEINWVHEFGEEDKKQGREPRRPMVLFDPYNKRLLLEGGAYEVRPEGITN